MIVARRLFTLQVHVGVCGLALKGILEAGGATSFITSRESKMSLVLHTRP